jgi:phosphoribosyl 1,2-cyclic phosphodiesterase
MKICLLASGSKGNSLLVCDGRTRLLIDAGLSARELGRRLALVDVSPDDLNAILVTHEHIDHVRGLGLLSRRYNLPVYLNHEIAPILADSQRPVKVVEFAAGVAMPIGSLEVKAFSVTHDAQATVGFAIHSGRHKVGVATDLGVATRLVAEELQGCRTLVLESNHDEEMLRDGPYPWPLKQRIRSNHGHLSNRDSAGLLETLCWEGLENVLLAHLSETNNHPELARQTAEQALSRQECCRPQLLVGSQERPTVWVG